MTTPPMGKDAMRRRQAQQEWAEHMRERAQTLEPVIAAALMASPGSWSSYMILRKTKLFEATHHCDLIKARKASEAPALLALLNHLSEPSWEGLVRIEEQCGRRYGLLDAWRDGPSGMADKFALALRLSIDPPPAVEDFL